MISIMWLSPSGTKFARVRRFYPEVDWLEINRSKFTPNNQFDLALAQENWKTIDEQNIVGICLKCVFGEIPQTGTDHFPSQSSVKVFKSGFSLIGYLVAGTDSYAVSEVIKNGINRALLRNYRTMEKEGPTDCAKMDNDEIAEVTTGRDMKRAHLACLSQIFHARVIVFDYDSQCIDRFWHSSDDDPIFVMGKRLGRYFLYVRAVN